MMKYTKLPRHRALLAVLLLTLSVSVVGAGEPVEKTVPVSFLPAEHINGVGDRVWLRGELQEEEDRGLVVIEAENATEVGLLAGVTVGSDPAASGEHYLSHIGHARYVFHTHPYATRALQTYYQWVRVNVPRAGSWVHNETMDAGEIRQHVDLSRETCRIGEWVWIKGPQYELAAGEHTFELLGYHGGIKLDKIIFTSAPDFVPEGQGPEASPSSGRLAATILSRVYQPTGLLRWERFSAVREPAGGAIQLEASVDGGRSFAQVPEDGSLRDFPVTPQGLQLKVTLTVGAQGQLPALYQPRLVFLTQPVAGVPVVLENERVSVRIHPEGNSISQFTWKGRGFSAGQEIEDQELFVLTVGRPLAGDLRELSSRDLDLVAVDQADPANLRLTYSSMEYQLEVVCTFSLVADQLHCGMEINNQDDIDVVRLSYPRLRGLVLGETAADDLLTTPVRFVRQQSEGKEWWQWGLDKGPLTANLYKRHGTLGFSDLSDPAGGGLYFGVHDPRWQDAQIRYSSRRGESLDLDLTTQRRVAPGQRVVVPPVVLAFHEGDWHQAADLYRAWAQRVLNWSEQPAWVYEWDGWLGGWCSHFLPQGNWNGLVQAADEAARLDVNYVQFWDIGSRSGIWYPFPMPEIGRWETFRQANQLAHQRGVLMTYYFAVMLYDLPGENGSIGQFLPEQFPDWLMKPDRDWYLRNAMHGVGGVPTHLQCMGASESRQFVRHFVVDVFGRRLEADGMYLDTLCAAIRPDGCMDLEHGHSGYGEEARLTATLAEQVITAGRQFNPNFSCSMEGGSLPLSQSGIFNMISGLVLVTEPRIMRYACPEMVILEGLSNGGRGDQRLSMAYAWLHGSRFERVEAPLAERLLPLRQTLSHHLYRSRYTDTVGVRGEQEGRLLVRRFVRNEDRNRLVCATVWNVDGQATGEQFSLDVRLCGPQPRVWLIAGPEDWRLLKVQPDAKGWLTLTVPEEEYTQVAVVATAEPMVWLDHVVGTPGGRGLLRASLRSLDGTSGPVTARLELPAGLEVRGNLQGDLQQTGRLVASVDFPSEVASGIHNATLHLVAGEHEWSLPVRLVVRDPLWVEVSPRGDNTYRVKLTNNTTEDLKVTVTVVAGSGEGNFYPPTQFVGEIEPVQVRVPARREAHAELTVPLAGPHDCFRFLDFILTYPGGRHVYLFDDPPVFWDPDFEQDRNGDGKLDYWPGRTYGNRPAGLLDYNDPHSGRACMRLDPPQAGQVGIWAAHCFGPRHLQPGHRYRFRAYIKRGAEDVEYGVNMYHYTGHGNFSLMLQPVGELDNVRKWQLHEAIFEVPADYQYMIVHMYHRGGSAPWWLDTMTMEHLQTAKADTYPVADQVDSGYPNRG